jgi:SAM-dependent methyltransferase
MTEPTNGIWSQWTADKYHAHSEELAAMLIDYLPKDQPVIDLGCGKAFYLAKLAEYGFECQGVEGLELNNFLHNDVVIHDLTKPIQLSKKGSVLCLEVMEHVPEWAEQTLLDSIDRHCTNNLILSWGLPGQAGIGHINLKPQAYAIEQMEARGFGYCEKASLKAQALIGDNTSWFRTTLMIFIR